ncbi:MAG: HypC/HybG/HupF family hydrogenase formation chaperone [Actinomycetota bacterium]|nr:HypC/HybG/HupF family hydrogenase formation chaperone [Actinomycetota bacterium]
MCLAIPGKVIKIKENDIADVEIGGIVREVGLHLAPETKEGDYVLVHAGYAIQTIDEEAARETLKLWEELGIVETP